MPINWDALPCGSKRKWERYLRLQLARTSVRAIEAEAVKATDPMEFTRLLVLLVMKKDGCGWNEACKIVHDSADYYGTRVEAEIKEATERHSESGS
jgi:hypothetical protein